MVKVFDLTGLADRLHAAAVKEASGANWSIDEAAAVLGVSRSTFYRIPYFRVRLQRISAHRVAVRPSDVRAYQELRAGVRRAS